MTLRRRITLVVALAVAVAVALVTLASYFVVRTSLYGQVDEQLRRQGTALTTILATGRLAGVRPQLPPIAEQLPRLAPAEGGPLGYVQFISPTGEIRTAISGPGDDFKLPVSAADLAIAKGDKDEGLRTTSLRGVPVRVLTLSAGSRGAIQLGTPLSSAEAVMQRLALLLVAISVAGLALAVGLSRAVTRRVTAPVRELADAAAHIAETDDLALRIQTDRDDELGQLAQRFNTMLDGLQSSRSQLAGSVAAQRQLVADASHELRTPITSLRTNLEVLLEGGEADPQARHALLSSLVEQTEELGALVVDVIDLARGDVTLARPEPVRLDEIVQDAVARARRHHPSVAFTVQAQPRIVVGAADRLARAATNLLDNAAKYGKATGPTNRVDVIVDDDGLTVRDHGPGVPADELDHLFDRFYRGHGSRERAGSGLGLAIVRQVAELHGGEAHVENAVGGGARFQVRLPSDVDPDAQPPAD